MSAQWEKILAPLTEVQRTRVLNVVFGGNWNGDLLATAEWVTRNYPARRSEAGPCYGPNCDHVSHVDA